MSSSSGILSLLPLLCFALLLHTTAIEADPLFHVCFSSSNFSANSSYDINLNRLETYLYDQTPGWGFALGSVGSNQYQAFGLSQCRADVFFQDCQTCVAEAKDALNKLCPYNKGGIVWYDNCLLKYLDQDFFGQIDNENKFCLLNVNNVSDPALFNKKVIDLLSQLSLRAYVNPRLTAYGETMFNEATTIYGLVDCTRDLSNDDCKKCLDEAINELPSCSGGKKGGRIVSGSCHVRYEIYPFLNF
ncbi:hypothetical protein Nepgr_013900 [Nepenthes gracilis]|uniref:Gnk2-homologous domain-containing protein n=1 Tax=Nepenthes gracilis TaxID=150966 RepID=A0AAD3XPM2_NEPGR|nr:hypothetical protein Nepgr_013900 [Nepenthes gracilis]